MIEILPAKFEDADLILRYIAELAKEEEFPFDIQVTKSDLEKNLFSSAPIAESLLAYYNGSPCGFAVYYYTFSTATGKRGLHLDDLYIEPRAQDKGIGKMVMRRKTSA